MPDFLKALFVNAPDVAPLEILIRLLAALLLGVLVAWIYRRTRKSTDVAASFPTTLVLLSVLIAMAVSSVQVS